MGIPSFHGNVMSSGLLPILIINTALTMAAIKHIFTHLLQILGLASTEEPRFAPQPLSHGADSNTNNNNYYETDGGLGSGLARLLLIAEDIQNNPPFAYLRSEGLAAEEHCAVCLNAFEEGDGIRKLPCCHSFHKICLDRWLHDRQMTCPLCRSSLVSQERMQRLMEEEVELADDVVLWFSSCNAFHG